MKFLFVLVFCFCSLFGRTFDDVIDEKHEQLMLQVFKGQEEKYRNIKFELDRKMVLHPKEYLFITNCFTKVFSLGKSAPEECRPENNNKLYFGLSLIFSEDKFITKQDAIDIWATHIYISLKMRGSKIANKNEWTAFFKSNSDLHKRWIEVCRANCRLTQAERAYDPLMNNHQYNSNTSPATSTSRRTFDDAIDEKVESMMLQVYKGQEERYYSIKAEIDRLIDLNPKVHIKFRNCIIRLITKGFNALPDNCKGDTILYYSQVMLPSTFKDRSIDDLYSVKLFIELKMRGTKIYRNDNWIMYFKRFPDLHKRWIEVCRANCRLTHSEKLITKPGPMVDLN